MEQCGQLGQWCKPAVKEVVPEGCRDVAILEEGGGGSNFPHRGSEQGAKATLPELCERERRGPLIGMCRQWVFAVGDGDHIYTKHPPLPPADVIRPDVRDVATVVLCERV